ncbi:MAG: peptidoglycan DD-metalloendopeptidase family protein [Nitrosomonas sp.]|uniref:murein hydrolase activator EnvC family protein n=1 Tax=Nitrosomonas sp. TaxID=42353 RepID=UPI0027332300|nr:peptidoglycan DD-metalloendopeptidase family protein [Nitrosomonas sp.]MDP3662907.1 peptidoglycan DD-metalloendopeptidase family protein [Nitrosomonas sp.]MDZ4105210.1 peptidoglycan DD-metalloendopeptidase family protein [Nitrosomonas sp.]
MRERIQSLQKDLTNKEALKQDTTDTLQETERAISIITHRLSKLIETDRQANEEYKQLQIQHSQIRDKIETERNQLERLLYQQYVGGQQDYLRLVLNQQNPNQIARDVYYYQQLSLTRSGIIKNLLNNQDEIRTLTQTSRQKKEEITAIQAEYFSQRKKLEQEKAKYQTILSQVSGQITQQQQEINKLEKDEKRITNLVNEINKLLVQEKSTDTLINNKLPDAFTTGSPFSALKGKLNLPVRGKLVNTFGGQRSGKHISWKGLFIQSPVGSDVKAISGGRVVFADWLRGFGNLIILDHGNSYMSLYGNNATLHKQVGDTIRGGDTIATVGNSGGNADSGLYFELRHGGKPFDPLTWIKIE